MRQQIPDCTFNTLIDSLEGMHALATAELPTRLSYAVMKLGDQLEEELSRYNRLRDEIQKKYEELPAEDRQEMMVEMSELAHLPVETEFDLIPLEDLLQAGVPLTPKQLKGLMPFFPEE